MRSLIFLALLSCATTPDPVTASVCQAQAEVVYATCEARLCEDEARQKKYGLRACEIYCYRQAEKERHECVKESE